MVSPRPRRTKPVPIAELLGRFMQRRGFSRTNEHRAVFRAWETVVPRAIGERTTPVSFRGGTLTVRVHSAPLMQELRCFRAHEFLPLLNRALCAAGEGVEVRKVDFRLV